MRTDDNTSANQSGDMLTGLLPPAKRKDVGKPTTSREKALYDGLSKMTRLCMIFSDKHTNGYPALIVGMYKNSLGSQEDARIVALKAIVDTTTTKWLSSG